eukprot:11733743-Prorocentrum_lima.AAC.1
MTSSLVGSEMCIRDRDGKESGEGRAFVDVGEKTRRRLAPLWERAVPVSVSYTHLTLPTICSV